MKINKHIYREVSITYTDSQTELYMVLFVNATRSCFVQKTVGDIYLVVGWLVVLRICVASAVFQPYRDLEAGDNQSLKIQVARPGIEPRSSCS